MKLRQLCLLGIILFSLSIQAKTKVACIGNSITENYDLKTDEKYPYILQQLLGNTNFDVRNYGASGCTVIKKGDFSYWETSKYNEILQWQPDIIVIKLGTNDMRKNNWVHKDDYIPDYIEFINSFKSLPSNPKIFVCYPLPAYPTNWLGIDDQEMETVLFPMLNEIARTTNSEIIDLHTPFLDKAPFTYDLIHPDFRGTTYLAHLIAPYICPDCEISEIPKSIFTRVAPYDMTDIAKKATTSASGDVDLSKLIDNDLQTMVSTPFTEDTWFSFEMPAFMHLSGYAITADVDNLDNSPVSWILQGGNLGNVWYKIDEQTNVDFSVIQTKLFKLNLSSASKAPKYRHFRILFKKNNGGNDLQMKEFQLFGFSVDMKSNLLKGGEITAQHEGFPNEGIENLVDGNIDSKYCVVDKSVGWMQYVLPNKTKADRYSLTSCFGLDARIPRSWTLKASNDGIKWDVLDTQVNQDFMSGFHTMEYKINSNKEYTTFRLQLDEITIGRTIFEIAEWQLFKDDLSSINTQEDTEECIYIRDKKVHIEKWGEEFQYQVFLPDGNLISTGQSFDNCVLDIKQSGVYIICIKTDKTYITKKLLI